MAVPIHTPHKIEIPEMSDKRLRELCQRIRPVVRMEKVLTTYKREPIGDGCFKVTACYQFDHPRGTWEQWDSGKLHYIKPVHPRNASFTWDPKHAKQATGLVGLCDITTYHSFGYMGCFKPSIYECIAMIPESLLDKVVAFEIVLSPEDATDLIVDSWATNQGYHVAQTRLYTLAPQE